MPKITFITHDGIEHVVEATSGQSIMEAALDNEVPGIEADCGGCCSCATCHVIVEEAWMSQVGAAGDLEQDMLSIIDERADGSRLSCQIEMNEELEGVVVRVPEFQM